MSEIQENLDRVRVLLSVHRALLMQIPPETRAIDVSWNSSQISLRYVLSRPTKFDMDEVMNEVEAEIEADFLPDATVQSSVEIRDDLNPIDIANPTGGEAERVFAIKEHE